MKKFSSVKKIVFTSLCVFFLTANNTSSQTFRNGYDNYLWTDGGSNQGFSFDINIYIKNSAPYALGAGENLYMESFINMYKATKDKKYLDLFIIHAFRVQTHRDDFVQSHIAGITGTLCTDLSAYPLDNDPTWSRDNPGDKLLSQCDGWKSLVLDDGNITYPMTEFVYLMQIEFASDADLQNTAVPTEALMPSLTSFNPYNMVATYSDFAEFLRNKIIETINFHECDWDKGSSNQCDGTIYGGYFTCGQYDVSNLLALNMQCAMGRSLALMYLVESTKGDQGNADLYHCHTTDIAHRLKSSLICPNPTDPSNILSYWWYDYTCVEDVNHAALVMSFADICYQYTIPDSYNNDPLFTFLDMQKFANAFVYHIYKSPYDFTNNTPGNFADNIAGGSINTCTGTSVADIPGGNTFLCQYNPYVYQIISNALCEGAIYGGSGDLINYPQLALYENLFNPIGVIRNNSPTQYSGVASGDFNNDGKADFVLVGDANGIFYTYSPDNCSNPNVAALSATSNCWVDANTGSHSGSWAGIAAGDFNVSHPGDEFMALNKSDGKIYYFEQTGASITEQTYTPSISGAWAGIAAGDFNSSHPGLEAIAITDNGSAYRIEFNGGSITSTAIGSISVTSIVGIASGNFDGAPREIATVDNVSGYIQIFSVADGSSINSTPLYQYMGTGGNYNNYKGITAGDFDGDGISEIIAYRDYDGQFLTFKVKNQGSGNQLVTVNEPAEHFPTDQQNGVMCSAPLSLSTNDALITLRNYDGQITIFDMGGLCQGLHLDNLIVNNASSIDNPYTNTNNNYDIDYHAQNTLTASNFTVESGSDVTFTSGQEIILLPGFHAEAQSVFYAYIDNINLGCGTHQYFRKANNTPPKSSSHSKTSFDLFSVNPNPTSGIFHISMNVKDQTSKDIFIYDVFGKEVYDNLKTTQSDWDIDISKNASGVYFVKMVVEGKVSVSRVVVM